MRSGSRINFLEGLLQAMALKENIGRPKNFHDSRVVISANLTLLYRIRTIWCPLFTPGHLPHASRLEKDQDQDHVRVASPKVFVMAFVITLDLDLVSTTHVRNRDSIHVLDL